MKSKVIYGPPGCGKTTHLVDYIKKCVDHGVSPAMITFMSFTRAAAAEAVSRLGDFPTMRITTIHGLAYRIFKADRAQVMNFSKYREFSNSVGVEISGGVVTDKNGNGDTMLAMISKARNSMKSLKEVYNESGRDIPWTVLSFFSESYTLFKSAYGYIDFDDMLEGAINRMKEGKGEFSSSVVIVDEAQDLTPLQWGFLEEIARVCNTVVVAGDDDQSIYQWSGADPSGMPDFSRRHNSVEVVLDKSYRVPSSIYTLSQALIRKVGNRVDKPFEPSGKEGTVARYNSLDTMIQMEGIPPGAMVLYRNHFIRDDIESTLINRCIPYHILNGPPSPIKNKWGAAISAWVKQETLTPKEMERINKVSSVALKHSRAHIGVEWHKRIFPPAFLAPYYKRVDMNAVPVYLSTIHNSKGREAEFVVVFSEMGQRTVETMLANPDSETRVFYVAITRAKRHLRIIEGNMGFKI